VPVVTYLGPFYERRRSDGCASWIRGKAVTVNQAWLDEWRHTLPLSHFSIEGDEGGESLDDGDGIPDPGWSRRDILGWLADNNVDIGSGYVTKTRALELVEAHLNPIEEGVE